MLTGGGALLNGCEALAERVLGLPAIRRLPVELTGLSEAVQSPVYATGVGIIRYVCREEAGRDRPQQPLWQQLWRRVLAWVDRVLFGAMSFVRAGVLCNAIKGLLCLSDSGHTVSFTRL